MRFIDLTGKQFGRLTVIRHYGIDSSKHHTWLCKCECGNEKIVLGTHLKSGRSKSCGCLHNDLLIERSTTHGMSYTRLNRIYRHIKQRCYNKNCTGYKYWGGRGITVCDEWLHDFNSFYNWAMSNGYADNLSIDRINNDGNYEPNNCRWATAKEQSTNRRCCKKGK